MNNSGDIPKSKTPETPPGWVIITDIYGHNYYLNISTDIITDTHPFIHNTLNKKASEILPTLNIINVTGGVNDILNYINMKKKRDEKKNTPQAEPVSISKECPKIETVSEKNLSHIKKKKTKCEICKKKSLILFNCKCGLHTCMKHKYPDMHNCTYDFKSENVLGEKCEFSKLNKINE